MADDLTQIFSKRTANAIAFDVSGKNDSYFKSLDDLKKRLAKNPGDTIATLGRVPGLGKKGILEIYSWATGRRDLPRTQGSLLREQQRSNAKARRIETLKQQIERASASIKAWNDELYDLGYRPPRKIGLP